MRFGVLCQRLPLEKLGVDMGIRKHCNDMHYIQRVYEQSFPKCERFPFWVLRRCAHEENVDLGRILFNNKPIGMQFSVKYYDEYQSEITYLMYFAIDKNFRGLGYGSQYLKRLVAVCDNILLCIEKPTVDDEVKLKRKSFYLRNGFHETGVCIQDTGVEYEFLSSVRGYRPTAATLRKRYIKMTTNPVVRHLIRKMFDVDEINLISPTNMDG